MAAKNEKSRIVEKWAGALAPGESVACGPDEVAVLMKWGALQGTLGAGRHAITEEEILVFFVRVSPVLGVRGGGSVGIVRDRLTDLEVPIQAMLEYGIRVRDPVKLVTNIVNATGDDTDDGLREWTSQRVLDAVRLAVIARGSVLDAIGNPSGLSESIVENSRAELELVGIEVTDLGSLVLQVPDEEFERLQASARNQREARPQPSFAQPGAYSVPPRLPESQPQLYAATPVGGEAMGHSSYPQPLTPRAAQPPSHGQQRPPHTRPSHAPQSYSQPSFPIQSPASYRQLAHGQQPQVPQAHTPQAPVAAYPQSLRIGGRVTVPWQDGQRYSGTIRRFQNGYFEIVWDNGSPPMWLLPHQVQPA
jgi:hypothetical protein